MTETVHVIGAAGRSGQALCRALLAAGRRVVPVVRSRARYEAVFGSTHTPDPGAVLAPVRIADLTDRPAALAPVFADAEIIVCTAHARNLPALLQAAPEQARIVALGSTRKFTRWPDDHGQGVLRGERALLASGRNGVILHPTMIYGASGENNVQRLASLLRRLPLVPLPGGGHALVQPIHQDDVTASLMAALTRDWDGPHSLVIAGPASLAYRDFVRLVGRAASAPDHPVVAVPAALLMAVAAVCQHVPGLPAVGPTEIRRLLEDKNFDIRPMVDTLGVVPVDLETGLSRLFSAC